ncbi:MAG TPA: bifunctional homocysteine S-methyltransferase/methylenetetrahydrofolate reductase [Bryobacteraceae bacterium]|nr:bifunctional homocysteine S-methyltransferase/methylenetetrahydrofolate reductase [Bryobacteraceae bacterium]
MPQSRAAEFREVLAERILVADGAMGTALYAKGVPARRCLDELNLSLPALVRDVHREYACAGAEILEANTFGANRKRLELFGFGEKVRAINQAGVRIAREAARAGGPALEKERPSPPFVAGAVGPLGVRLEPLGSTTCEQARAIFREQIEALVEAGVDLLMLETFRDLRELHEAVMAARQLAGPHLVVAAHLSVEDDGSLADGASTEEFTRRLNDWPLDMIGLNCSSGPKAILETAEKMIAWTNKPLSVLPNAGLPVLVNGANVYLCSPAYVANYARRFFRLGVRVVGGCCGTTPEHIKEIRAHARIFQAEEAGPRLEVSAPPIHPPAAAGLDPVPFAQKSDLAAKLAAGRFVTLVEIVPPRGLDASREVEGARLCKQAGVDCVNVPNGPRASARLSAAALCHLIHHRAGMETLLHFCCRDRNLLSIQSDLLGASAMGIPNLLCITGDPPRTGAYPDATAVFDVDSVGLVALVHRLNRGLDLGANPMGSRTALAIGVAVNPAALDPAEELRRFEAKIKAGAEFAVTQPVFQVDLLEAFLKRIEPFRIPIIVGIWPLTGFRNAEFLVNELNVPVPPEYMRRMSAASSPEAAQAEGLAIARELVQRIRPMAAGVQISTPSARYQAAIEVAQAS